MYIFGLHPLYFFGVKRSFIYFFGSESLFDCINNSVSRYLSLVFFWIEILMPGIFLIIKFKAHVFFWVHNIKLHWSPLCHVY